MTVQNIRRIIYGNNDHQELKKMMEKITESQKLNSVRKVK